MLLWLCLLNWYWRCLHLFLEVSGFSASVSSSSIWSIMFKFFLNKLFPILTDPTHQVELESSLSYCAYDCAFLTYASFSLHGLRLLNFCKKLCIGLTLLFAGDVFPWEFFLMNTNFLVPFGLYLWHSIVLCVVLFPHDFCIGHSTWLNWISLYWMRPFFPPWSLCWTSSSPFQDLPNKAWMPFWFSQGNLGASFTFWGVTFCKVALQLPHHQAHLQYVSH